MSEKEEKSARDRSNKANTSESLSDAGGGARPPHIESNSSITGLRPHDVLLGRGSGCNDYEGNVRFRSLVNEHKREYLSTTSNREDKRRIAQKIFDQITMNGGRFLKKEAKRKVNGIIVNRGVYLQVHYKVAMEKVKQALRQNGQNWQPRDNDTEATNETHHDKDQRHDQNIPQPPFGTVPEVASAKNGSAIQGLDCPQVNHVSDTLQSTLVPNAVNPAPAHARLLLFQGAELALHQQPIVPTTDQPSTVSLKNRNLPPLGMSLPSPRTSSLHDFRGHPLMMNSICPSSRQTEEPAKEPPESSDSREDARVALDSLSMLTMTGRPKFTEQQRLEELALLSDEERMHTLMDKFGRLCIASDRQTKKPRIDLDQASISFLVCQMKLELDRIPDVQKLAMLEANAKCRLDEFSDARLTQFLRVEGMNVTLAARRFVKYWECRKETFGPEKFTMRMTLTEALRDDLVAIEEGVLFLLPLVDLSGRVLLFMEPHRRRADRYSAESLLRAIWYIMEVAAEQSTNIGSDCVQIIYDKTSTIFDFPRAVYDRLIEFEKACLPLRYAAFHSCCPNVMMNTVMRPVMLALSEKRARSRIIVHNVPESAILDALISYGITDDMLPTELRGTIVLNQREWMENRLAVEMEEIS